MRRRHRFIIGPDVAKERNARESRRRCDADGREDRRKEVQLPHPRHHAAAAWDPGTAHQERDPHDLLVQRPTGVEAAVFAELLAVVRDEDNERRAREVECGEPVEERAERRVHHRHLQSEVRRGDATGRFDDVVGRGFTLVSLAADPARHLPAELAAFFASVGGIGAHVAPGGPVHDLNGSYAKWFAEHPVAVALARPDFHVFGTAPTIDGAAALVGELRTALSTSAETV